MIDIAGERNLQVCCCLAAVNPQVERVRLSVHLLTDNRSRQQVHSLPLSKTIWPHDENLCRTNAKIDRRA